jgi:hypothetical protein
MASQAEIEAQDAAKAEKPRLASIERAKIHLSSSARLEGHGKGKGKPEKGKAEMEVPP